MQISGRDLSASDAPGDDHLTLLVLPEHVDVVRSRGVGPSQRRV